MLWYTPTTFTRDQYVHHVVLDALSNANNFRNIDLREWNPRTSDERNVVITSSVIRFSQIFVSNVFHLKKCPSRRVGDNIGHK